jgi:hypothetical protein
MTSNLKKDSTEKEKLVNPSSTRVSLEDINKSIPDLLEKNSVLTETLLTSPDTNFRPHFQNGNLLKQS